MPAIWGILNNNQIWQIIDGANRLNAIYEFQNNKFPVSFDFGKGFTLYNFEDMLEKAQKKFQYCNISLMWVSVGEVGDDPLLIDLAMLELYALINIEPVPQDKTHILEVKNRAIKIRQKLLLLNPTENGTFFLKI